MSGHRERIKGSDQTLQSNRGYRRVVFRFMLKGGDWWTWPVEGRSSIAAFRELLDRAQVVYTEHDE